MNAPSITGKILIVDDVAGIHDMMDMLFLKSEFELRHAYIPGDAIKLYQEQPADVVIVDIHMPSMDGLELIQELQQIDNQVVCVMITASDSKDYVLRALRLGVYDYIEKPFEEKSFMCAIKRACMPTGGGESDRDFYETKLATGRYYMASRLPANKMHLARIETGADPGTTPE